MICLTCGHYSNADGEMERAQNSGSCSCRCHPWNRRDVAPAADLKESPKRDAALDRWRRS